MSYMLLEIVQCVLLHPVCGASCYHNAFFFMQLITALTMLMVGGIPKHRSGLKGNLYFEFYTMGGMDMSYNIAIENGIAKFTIDRPEMRNAINYAVMEGLEKFLDQIEENPEVAYAVITGAGDRAFCSGGDLSEFHSLRTADEAYPMLSKMAGLLYRVATLPMPVIALVNGTAVGGGCEIATCL